jgi:flagellar hook protein FlgE
MTGFGAFQASVQGMKGQSHALATIGTNIVNATTTGYKRAETRFETVLGTVSQGGRYGSGAAVAGIDYGGVGVVDVGRVREGGEIAITGGALDVAIDGRGFFSVSRDRTGAEPVLFTRDGSFAMGLGDTASATGAGGPSLGVDEGYLVDRSGNYVLGWAIADDGLTAASGQPAGLRIDADAFTDTGRPTGEASLDVNLPAMAEVGTTQSYRMDVFDSGGLLRGLDVIFGRTPTAGAWSLLFADAAGDPVAVDPPAAGGPGTSVRCVRPGHRTGALSGQRQSRGRQHHRFYPRSR